MPDLLIRKPLPLRMTTHRMPETSDEHRKRPTVICFP
jgi:hypothetical protein